MENATATRKPRQRKPRPSPERRIAVVDRDPNGPAVVVRLEDGRKTDYYSLRPLASDFGHAYEVKKIGPAGFEPGYAVNLDPLGAACDCLGFTHHGHCRHVEGIAALRNAGQL